MEQIREGINNWFEKHQVAWELFMVLLAIVFVVTGFLPREPFILALDIAISAFFVTEFAVRIAASRSRAQYLLNHWMDIVALLPAIPGYQNASVARMARLLRLLMVLRLLGAVDRIMKHVRGVTAQPGLTYLTGLIVVMVLSVAAVGYFVERGINDGLDSYSDAIYWALVTVTTTGYGDIVPKTPLGRSLASLLMIGGLVLWSLLTASIIGYINGLTSPRSGRGPRNGKSSLAIDELKVKLDNLDSLSGDDLVSLKGSVTALIDSRMYGSKSQREGKPPSPLKGEG